jgi:hypothetical protein
MEGQSFFNTVAGLSVSPAGFASLIAWLRDDLSTWDPINLWRVKTIVRDALTLAGLALVLTPIFSLVEDPATTVRVGSALLVVLVVVDMLRNRRPDPVIWNPFYTWKVFMTGNLAYVALLVPNLWLESLGILQLGYMLLLLSPAGIFYNFVRELGGARQAAPPGSEGVG